ncbi:hypothetical protein CICLE_v10001111mg [Citrus x clementina]|uniref:Uncharacterized protein n=1 Tax=Citrus clementina TaxID=85681 RepID=V4T7B7_CITCL|nr:salutaridinol 7-O-acetyltransferase [Citrus x clementina]XP_006464982.1 stemmadenine O-acetyltransferase-like [Citrus sinensis]ESR45466.1 hypothetical protein CICLE_v10001111mg [Citrus x clementina]
MEVEIISRECIKPSSPTPLHLKTYKFSLLDQFRNHIFAPRVLYYPLINLSDASVIDHIVSKRLQLLKQSLSETLVRFYPLAGKMTENFSINCNDEGIYFVEARAKSPLNEFLNKPDPSLTHKFFPVEGSESLTGRIAGAHVAKVQITSFPCGGLVICSCFSHMFGDGTSFSLFMKSWAATARKSNTGAAVMCPNFDASILFPPNEAYPRELNWNSLFTRFFETGRFVMRRFVFDAKAIADLKAKAIISSCVQNPTRVEVVSALLSKHIMATFKLKSGPHKPTLLTHVVNLRPKARPPLPGNLIGNIVWHTNVLCEDEEVELAGLASQLRQAITKLDGDFLKSLQGSEGFLTLCKAIEDEAEAYYDVKDRILFSSWCTFGFYEIDFGWGRPTWVSCVGLDGSIITHSPTIVLTDTRLRDGIEAWVFLLDDDMALLEVDEELLAFANLDPSPFAQN